jgi:hypothetical protein
MIVFIVIVAFASLAVDVGRYQLARAQLGHAAEAAARGGAADLDDGTSSVRNSAKNIASANFCDALPVALADSDIEIGRWDIAGRVFTPGGSTAQANAVRVTARRTVGANGQIPLSFAALLGTSGCNAEASAVARLTRELPQQGLVGLDEVRFSSIGVLAQIQGDVASNGNIYIGTPLGLLVSVDGDVQSYGGNVSKGVLAAITGSKSPLSQSLDCPSVEVPTGNNNDQIIGYLDSQGDFNALLTAQIPQGTYVVRDLNLLAGLNVNLQGPVTFYVTRNVNMAVGVNLLGNSSFDPSKFKVRVASGGNVNLIGNLITPVSMDLYAPDADILIGVTVSNFRGRIVGKKINIAVPALSRFDMRDPPSDPRRITLVK